MESSMNAIHFLTGAAIVLGHVATAWAQDAQGGKLLGVLLAAGDIAWCKEDGHKATAAILRAQMANATKNNVPVLVLALGDLAYPGGGQAELNCFHSSWGKAVIEEPAVPVPGNDAFKKPENRLLPVPGNHEYRGDRRFFPHLRNRENPWVEQQGTNTGYFVVNFPHATDGPGRIIELNSELSGPDMEKQNDWLVERLNDTKPRCVLAFWHKPLISSGEHGHGDCGKACKQADAPLCRPNESSKACDSAELKKMQPAYSLLYQRGASLVLTGHDHHFEQFGRHDPNGKPDEMRGLRAFVVGTGGTGLYKTKFDNRWERPLGEIYSHDFKGVLRIDLYQDRYTWKFVSTDKDNTVSLKIGETVVDHDTCNERR